MPNKIRTVGGTTNFFLRCWLLLQQNGLFVSSPDTILRDGSASCSCCMFCRRPDNSLVHASFRISGILWLFCGCRLKICHSRLSSFVIDRSAKENCFIRFVLFVHKLYGLFTLLNNQQKVVYCSVWVLLKMFQHFQFVFGILYSSTKA